MSDAVLGARLHHRATSGSSRMGRIADHPVLTLAGLWLAQVIYLAGLQLARLPYGFAVWPMGEDRNWLRFMLDAPGVAMTRDFWLMNDRNPLSPWWYWLFARPILAFDPSLYLLRRAVDLLVAVAVTLLVRRLLGSRGAAIALLAGILVLACSFNGYREQIVWNFMVALALALLAACAYTAYVDSGRAKPLALAAALLLFLVAIGTYTLDIGIAILIAGVAVLRGEPKGLNRVALADVGLFAVLGGLFLAIWYTISRPTSTYYHLDPALIPTHALASARDLLWHHDFSTWIAAALHAPQDVIVGLPLVLLFGLTAWHVVSTARIPVLSRRDMAWLALAFVAIALPVVLLESMSAVWLPGHRSRMIYQVSAPLLLLLVTGAAAGTAWRVHSPQLARGVAVVAITVPLGLLLLAGTAYNRALNVQTRQQRTFADALAQVARDHPSVRVFLVRYPYDPAATWGSDALSDTYARTMLRRSDVTMRLIPFQPAGNAEWAAWWRVQVRGDAEGVANASVGGGPAVPYPQVLFVEFDGTRLTIPPLVDAAWFTGLQADWHRDAPLRQAVSQASGCPASLYFDAPPPGGRGWSVPEAMPGGGNAMWMAARHAQALVGSGCAGDLEIVLDVVGYMAPDILTGLSARVDGKAVSLHRDEQAAGTRLVGRFSRDARGTVELELDAPRTIVPAGGDRTLAVMFRAITIRPRATPR
jgi:hypothetical protein